MINSTQSVLLDLKEEKTQGKDVCHTSAILIKLMMA